MIDMSDLINDPDFAQVNGISITRSVATVLNHRPSTTETNITLQGIITIANDNESDDAETASLTTEKINIYNNEKLKCTGTDKNTGIKYIADVVHFNGTDYKVIDSLDDSQYGFCKATAKKIDQDVM